SKNDYSQLREDKDRPLYNRAIRGVYPFGSTIKPFFALNGLNEKVIDPDNKLFCNGYFYLPGVHRAWRDWNHKKGGHGRVAVHGAIMCSCDVFFYTLAVKVGIVKMGNILHQFGFGELTHIDVTDELPGVVPSPEWKRRTQKEKWYPGDTVISGIGQGFMLTTPIQLANATATLSVRGVRHQPQLLSKFQKPNGEMITQPPILQKPIEVKDPHYWDIVIDAMADVIRSARGTAYVKFGQTTLYTAAAKTGTAQVYRPPMYADKKDEDVPLQYRDNSMFIAFAPVEKPEIAIAVVAENSHAAAKVARAVFDAYFTNKLPTPTPNVGAPNAQS
ncbi:MAG: penicillin-binding transpeptidase domain-containing protein, partial [Pseudomonadota bacterium]|nr:penicillin-binding transpeptidase domain-containing protein [Pseudomonadota bacterium]